MEKQIRIRAHQLWEQAGKPEGREDEFWHQAERELQGSEEHGNPAKSKSGRITSTYDIPVPDTPLPAPMKRIKKVSKKATTKKVAKKSATKSSKNTKRAKSSARRKAVGTKEIAKKVAKKKKAKRG